MNFYLPDFYNNYKLNMKIIELLSQHPEYFYDNIKIGGVYGTFPGAIWNGGRTILGTTQMFNIKNTIQAFNNLNIPLYFTFTNNQLTNSMVYDTYCNLIMNLANNGYNGIVINSPILEEYLRENYPNFKYILSTTLCERNIDNINNACNKYDLVILDYRDNNNFSLLNQLTATNKIELLINSYCDPNCKLRQYHYDIISKNQIMHEYIKDDKISNCPTYSRNFFDILNFDTVIKNNDLQNLYNQTFKINHFKIEGRTSHPVDVIDSYIYYLIRPEYGNQIKNILLKYIYN